MAHGRLWRTTTDGIILSDARREYIQPPFKAVVNDLVGAVAANIGADAHSIYVTGSIARGLAVPGESDANVFAVLTETSDPELVRQDWIGPAEVAAVERYACISDAQIELWPYGYVFGSPDRFSIGGFIVRTHSVCLWGSDLANELPDYRLGPAIPNDDIVQLQLDLEEASAEVRAGAGPENARYWCRRIMKNILRAGFGLVMLEEGVFTRDIDLCCEVFSKHYPGHAADMRRALALARQPSTNAGEVLTFLDSWGSWMIRQADIWLDRHNPHRDLALLVDDLAEPEDE
jgi:hypothetical protein